MSRVLVTRPEPLASRTAGRLTEMGFVPVVLPLSETRALPVDLAGIPPAPGALAVTSANALRNAPRELLQALAGIPCHAVGAATSAAAKVLGFRTVEGPGDAEGMAGLLLSKGMAPPVVYLCGRVRRPEFEERLRAAGIEVTAVETYDTVGIRPAAAEAASVIGESALAAALVYSAGASGALGELAGRPELAGRFRKTVFLCLSPRVADRLGSSSRREILVASEPTEAALLSLLAEAGRPAA